ncbi:hypothetical protein P344_03605 [Spiroplasma mirum ATCC 29335]|uniref:Uncharacterized protein n=1 Tax=Spiroplasma mirum ATCC 29335 TaxID=838561 RepID=W0GR35_9MOLU|nr:MULTISPECIES: hypothetical protein [Spiroplasma]AHF61031.1 truncated helicase [Spiroplasma mirum ATCC 29335]AHI58062.1 hypothetical protein P344_03605 [Spiroplasma mirum ATCC 29335]
MITKKFLALFNDYPFLDDIYHKLKAKDFKKIIKKVNNLKDVKTTCRLLDNELIYIKGNLLDNMQIIFEQTRQ